MKITKQIMRSASTKKGGYTRKQIEVAQQMFPDKWKAKMIGADVPLDFWDKFVKAAGKKGKFHESVKKKSKAINTVSINSGGDWNWKPEITDIPKIKVKKVKTGKNKQQREKISRLENNDFYTSREWRQLRVRVLEKYECKCMMCGRSPMYHGIVVHVDHIKPRSKYPDLSLDITNLQILCEDCNKGKSNKYDTDWRPDHVHEIQIIIEANNYI